MSSAVSLNGAERVSKSSILSPVHDIVARLYEKFRGLDNGQVATYIPELAKADRDWFGISLATPDGQIYEVGDTTIPFTIQSISKPFVYAAALALRGAEAVFQKVGVEPSGDAFNAISLDPISGRPANPMINAGAIATTGLLPGRDPTEVCSTMLSALSSYAGRPLSINHDVYVSERDTGYRNHAIAFMLKNAGILDSDPLPVVDAYFRQCSVEVTCRDLGVMAAMLASGGLNPFSGERVLESSCVESVLSVMATCGMYNFAGEWTFGVGLPAKSGVSGGILACLPGRLGIAVFSPPLDAKGNSVRGMEVCRALSRTLDLHLFAIPAVGRTVIHRRYSGTDVTSNRVRTAAEYALLKERGEQICVYELQGELSFSSAEVVVRDIGEIGSEPPFVVVDLERVTSLNRPACNLFSFLARKLASKRRTLIFTRVNSVFAQTLRSALRSRGPEESPNHPPFKDVDFAMEWCENCILADSTASGKAITNTLEMLEASRFELLAGLAQSELDLISEAITVEAYAGGEHIVQAGAEDSRVYLLQRGQASAVITLRSGREARLATFSAGMSFGEMALIGNRQRSATVYADTSVQCLVLDVAPLARIWADNPRLKAVMMENLACDIGRKLRRTNETISTLAR